jgi:mono/diheme cytochrome c family protein
MMYAEVTMRTATILSSIVLAVLPTMASAQNVEHGRALAERWCASCHVVGTVATSAQSNGLPTFPALAARSDITANKLKAQMNSQHSRMPNLEIGTRDQDDLAAYILSLKQK